MLPDSSKPDWKTQGVRITRAGDLDTNTPQTPGMSRAAAITHATAGANKRWAGTVVVEPAAPYVPHPGMNARPDEPVECVVVRSGQEPIVVNRDIAEASAYPPPFRPPAHTH